MQRITGVSDGEQSNDGNVHVIPLHGGLEHRETLKCWCGPAVDPLPSDPFHLEHSCRVVIHKRPN